MKLRLTAIAMAITLLCSSAFALAQQADTKSAQPAKADSSTAKPAVQAGEMAKVEIKGSAADYDPRRDDTASKTVLSHEEIIKYGDTNIFDVLKRAPGVTVIGTSIRMRGLGAGYTQILVNGERPPPGFSMDSLVPEQIDRIEVIRSATAEHSMQAIGGMINIVLKKVVAKPQRDLRLNAGRSEENKNVMLWGTLADRQDNLSYYVAAMIQKNHRKSATLNTDEFDSLAGQVLQFRDIHSKNRNQSTSVGVQPRLNWKLANDEQLNVSVFANANRSDFSSTSANTNLIASLAYQTPDYIDGHGQSDISSNFYGGDVNWVAKLWGGKLDAKVALSKGRTKNDYRSLLRTADGSKTFQRDTYRASAYSNYSSTGKYGRTLFAGHSLATGYEVSSQRTETDSLKDEGQIGATLKTQETFSPQVTKLAAYAQDEWNITKNWSMYFGARWEAIRTRSAGSDLPSSESNSNVLSPVAQTLYKFPDKSGRQLRMALTRTYKAPDVDQLSARRFEAIHNTRSSPDHSGNPNLQPELATGIDLTYEHFWAPGAVFSVGGSVRQIKDYIRSKMDKDPNSPERWLIQPLNDGSAQVRTLDLELKFPLKAIVKDAPAYDFRASVNRNWSKVESVPGPDNRLDQQVPLTAVLGIDYKQDKFSTGASFAFRKGGPVRVSDEQFSRMQPGRELEAYLLYKIRTGLQLRTTISNALGEDYLNESHYVDLGDKRPGITRTWSRSNGSPRLHANLEMKF